MPLFWYFVNFYPRESSRQEYCRRKILGYQHSLIGSTIYDVEALILLLVNVVSVGS